MKKLLKISLLLVIALFTFNACTEDDDSEDFIVDYESLPTASKDFITNCFGTDATVTQTKERYVADTDGTYYMVYLTGGYEVDFNKSGIWVSVENGTYGLSQSVLLKILKPATLRYLTENYPTAKIEEVDNLGVNGYEVDLKDGNDLLFDSTGEFRSEKK